MSRNLIGIDSDLHLDPHNGSKRAPCSLGGSSPCEMAHLAPPAEFANMAREMSTPKDTEPTVEQTREQAAEAEAARERIAALRRAAALRERTARAFDTRTELWQEAGLSSQVDKAESRKAMREAIVLVILLAGVLYLFGERNSIFGDDRDAKQAVRYVTAGLLILLGWGLARTFAKGVAPALMRRMDPGTAGSVGFLIRLFTIVAVVFGALAIAGVNP
jgi:hypothetical protein